MKTPKKNILKKSKKINKTMNDITRDTIMEMASILHGMGKIDAATLKEYKLFDIPKIKSFKAKDIKNIREHIKVSQPVFAKLLNISPETIKKWEQGERHPTGSSLKLLNLVASHGLEALY